MKYRRLANTGIYVSELCLGAMTFGGIGQFEAIGALGQKEADTLVHRSLDAGVNFFDTANVYSVGRSEEMLGTALGARRPDVIVATKVRGRMGDGPNQIGLSRVHIMQECDASLRRLGTDYIDLYQIHGHDPDTDIQETLGALNDLVRAGKVRPDKSEFGKRYEPSHPAADADGYVLTPNVNTLIEMTDMREAQRSYEANLNVIKASKAMLNLTIDVLR